MKKFINYFLLAAILPALIITGCKDNTDPVPAEKGNFETLKSYMVANDLDLLGDQLLAGWVIAPKLTTADGGIVEPDVNTIPTYHVFDIRGADDFNAGHIPGALNVALVDIVTFAADYSDKPILVVCKTGQTAGRGAMALRLSGFPDAKVMKFGMSYWNATYDLWTGQIDNLADGSPNWTTDASAALPVNDFPQWETTSTDGAEILAANVDAMLAASGWGVDGPDVLADPAAYNIYNFWSEADYTTFGHFTDAYQLNPISLANDAVYALPTSDVCLIYCFTGQTSSFATAWLQVLGYNAKSIKFGVNKLKYDELDAAGKPTWHHSFDYVSETK